VLPFCNALEARSVHFNRVRHVEPRVHHVVSIRGRGVLGEELSDGGRESRVEVERGVRATAMYDQERGRGGHSGVGDGIEESTEDLGHILGVCAMQVKLGASVPDHSCTRPRGYVRASAGAGSIMCEGEQRIAGLRLAKLSRVPGSSPWGWRRERWG
jgi:hypothetical protein